MQAGAEALRRGGHKKDFGFIDFVTPVRDRDLLEKLDGLAFAELQGLVDGNASDLHIALPDILDPEEGLDIGYYGVGLRSGAKPAHTELAIENYVEDLRASRMDEIPDMATLRGRGASHRRWRG
jgi:uncharacterized protein (TIGR04141 family)